MEVLSLKLYFLLFYCLCILQTTNNVNIRQIHLVFRHGERSPSLLYSNPSYDKGQWPDGLGQLTKNGKLQMYELGHKIRKKYAYFIPDYYFPEDVKVLSSYADRCLMSAELFTSGLFVPKNEQIWNEELLWQPIPIIYKPRSVDNIIAAKQNCTKYDNFYKNIFKTPKYERILNENSELFKYLTKQSGINIDSLRKVEELYNTLLIEQINNLSLPKWTQEVFPTPMKDLASLNLASFTDTQYMKKIKGGPFLKHLSKEMENSLINEKAPKLFVYSGHDLTLVNVLRSLDLVTIIKPDFAAYIIFELHTNTDVKIFYSNCSGCEEKEFYLNDCGETCKLKKFVKILDPVLPKNWEDDCRE